MIDTSQLCFGQRIDPELGILEPWYVNAAVDKIKTWDLSKKVIGEWGGGASSLWWQQKAQEVNTVDHNFEWCAYVNKNIYNHSPHKAVYVQTHEGDQGQTRDWYVQSFFDRKPDICIVDGIHRYECAEYSIKVLKPEILIIDNHQQDYVFMCPALDELTKGLRMERYIQPDHTDHSGNPWATAFFYLDK